MRVKYNYDVVVVQKLKLDLPAFLMLWGLFGSIGYSEPSSILIATLVLGILSYTYMVISETEEIYEIAVGKRAIVDIAIRPNAKGQIIMKSKNGNEYFVAEAHGTLIKPLIRGSSVMIHHFDGVIAKVYETGTDVPFQPRSKINKYSRIVNYLKKSGKGTCMICKLAIGDEKIVTCPFCQYTAHLVHLQSWLEIRNNCPNCKSTITLTGGKIQLEVKI